MSLATKQIEGRQITVPPGFSLIRTWMWLVCLAAASAVAGGLAAGLVLVLFRMSN